MRVVFGTGLGEEKGEAEELAMFSRLATRRRRSSNLSVTTIWLEARWELAFIHELGSIRWVSLLCILCSAAVGMKET